MKKLLNFITKFQLKEEGFTLIETIAVLLISGILIASLTLLTGQWLKSWDRGVRRLQTAEMLAVGLNRLEADIESALPLPPLGPKPIPSFIGSEDTIVFVRSAAERSNTNLLEFIKIKAEPDGSILRERAPYDPNLSPDAVTTQDAVKLIDLPFKGSFEFRNDAGKWSSEWSAPNLPSSVRILIKGQKSKNLEKVSLVVGTKVSVPAACANAGNYTACKAIATGQPVPSQGPNPSKPNSQTPNQNQAPKQPQGNED